MKLTFAEIPLLLPDAAGHLQNWIDTHIPRELGFPDPVSLMEGPFAAHGCFDKEILTFNYSSPPRLNLNEWYFPTGATRWGFGFFLAGSEQRFHIVNATTGGLFPRALTFDTSDMNHVNGSGVVTYETVSMLTPRPFGGHRVRETYENIPGEFWILPLVDKRYWWQFRMVALSKDYITTWEEMIQEIASQMGITVTIPGTISADFGWPDKIEFLRRENGAKLLDLAAACIGRRVALQRDGTVVLNTAATAYASVKSLIEQPSAVHKITGRPSMAYALMPSSIGLQFSQSDCAELPYEKRSVLDLFNDVTQTVALDDFFGAVPIGGTEYVVPSSVRATAASAESDAMASAIARGIYSWWTTAYDFTAAGVVPQWPHGLEDYILIQYGTSPHGARCQTRFVSFPPNCWISQHFAQLTDADRDCECHPIVYAQAKEVILPGEIDAEMWLMEWNEIAGDHVATASVVNVSDPLFRNCLLIGERAEIKKHHKSDRWELSWSQGLLRQVRIYEDIDVGNTGSAYIVDHNQINILLIAVENQTDQNLITGDLHHAEYLLHSTGDGWVIRIGAGEGGARCDWFLSPELGLPAADWDEVTATLTPTSTVCNRMEYVAGDLVAVAPPEPTTILNASHLFAIPEAVPFKAIQIAGQWYAIIEHPVLVPLQLTQTGSGTAGTPEDYLYTVDDLQYGDQWTDVDIVATPHKYKRPEGNVQAATFGLGYRDWANDELVIMWTNERGLQSVRPLSITQTGGANGDGTTVATWTYSVTDLLDSGNNLTGVNPTAAPHKWRRSAGLLTAATFGLGYLDTNGDLVVTWINEYPPTELCT